MGEHEIAWVDAEVGKEDEKLVLLPPSSTPPPHKPVLVGDLKLSDFKQFLENKDWQVGLLRSQVFDLPLYLK